MKIARGLATRLTKRGFTDEEVLALVAQGLKSTTIQSQLGCTAQIIRHICRKHGKPGPGRDYGYTDDLDQTIIQLRKSGIGNTAIAETLGVSGNAIAGKLYRLKAQFDLPLERIKSVAPVMTSERKAKIAEVHQAKRGYLNADVVEMIKVGITQKKILDRFGCSRKLIYNLCKRHDLKIPPREPAACWAPEKVQTMMDLIEAGHNRKEIAAKMGITLGAVIAKFNKMGVYPQRKVEPQKPAQIRFSGTFPDADAIAAFISSRGVTQCPAAAVAVTSASLPAHDRAALAKHQQDRLNDYLAKIAPRQQRATEASKRALEMRK